MDQSVKQLVLKRPWTRHWAPNFLVMKIFFIDILVHFLPLFDSTNEEADSKHGRREGAGHPNWGHDYVACACNHSATRVLLDEGFFYCFCKQKKIFMSLISRNENKESTVKLHELPMEFSVECEQKCQVISKLYWEFKVTVPIFIYKSPLSTCFT